MGKGVDMTKILVRVDGSCMPNPGKMAIGVVVYRDGELISKVNEIVGVGTNNMAEYHAVIRGLEEVKDMLADQIEFYCDSQLLVKQLNKQFKVKNPKIILLYQKIQELLEQIKPPVFFVWNRREENHLADSLARKLLIKEEQNQRAMASNDLEVMVDGNNYLVKNQKSQKVYHVNLEIPECDCYDFQNHCKEWNLECKHIVAVRKYLKMKEQQSEKPKEENKRIEILILSKMVSQRVWQEILNRLNLEKKLPMDIDFPCQSKEGIESQIAQADVIVGGELTEKDLLIAKKLKLFQIPFAGIDKQDLRVFQKFPQTAVCNTHANHHAVSEHAFALLLALTKKIIPYDHDLRNGKWHGFVSQEPTMQLYGKNIGIIGLGAIGLEIAKKALAFGMNVYAIKRRVQKEGLVQKEYGLTFLGTPGELDYVVENSDFIILAVPLTPKTENMFDDRLFRKMKGKYLVNIGRGRVVNEEALYYYLKNGYLAGAAIDTWYQYPDKNHPEKYPSQYPIHELDNVILSPHNAGYTDQAIEENISSVYQNILKIFNGERPDNQVNLSEGY
ncbi:MAG: reverse transcriptase-like protein [Candidatus Atribacteria bacterium]|nr:reverse transcriptase-like protein [Candidatus Atribacteria bacterium]